MSDQCQVNVYIYTQGRILSSTILPKINSIHNKFTKGTYTYAFDAVTFLALINQNETTSLYDWMTYF